MKILVISQMFPCMRHPTSAVFFANLMKELAPKLDELIVVTPRPYIPKALTKIKGSWKKWYLDPMITKENGIEVIRPYVPVLRGIGSEGINGILMQFFLFKLFKHLIKTRGIDLVLGYNMIPEGIAAVRLARSFNLPVAFWAIGSDVNDFAGYNRINKKLSVSAIENCSMILTESKDLERMIWKLSSRAPNVRTFYKGIDVSNFQNIPSRDVLLRKLGLDRSKRYILFVGRLIYDKGIYELAESFSAIAKLYPDMKLIMIGEEIEKAVFLESVSAYGIKDRIHFTGIVPYKKVAEYMKVSDLLVFPSWVEGLPNVIMESMAIGLPVVASNAGGIPEILKDGVTGLSVPVRDAGKLTDAIIKMLTDYNLRTNCIKNAQQLIRNKFDVRKNVNLLLKIFQNLMRQSPRCSNKEVHSGEAISIKEN